MSYQALARKYRPQSFRDIIGQETLVRTLQNAIEQKRIHHAYLLSGVRGVGKTTTARILAKALNCVKGPTLEPCNVCTACVEITEGIDMDVREIDAATYTGVDNIRELREVTQFQPARDRYRIFIVDEAHMLSTAAWNALLKILEEPPSHVVFMFATTEMHKVPQTILSRVQKFALRKITLDELIGRLAEISKSEGIEAERDALEIVARRGEGSVRDALSLLDQIIAFGGRSITAGDVAAVLGLSDTTFFARVISLIAEGDHAGVLEALQDAAENGRDFKMLYRDLLNFTRNLLLIAGGARESMLSGTPEDVAVMKSLAGNFEYTELLRIANLLLRDDETVNRAEHQRLAVEIALLKAATFPRLRAVEDVLSKGGAAAAVSPKRVSAEPVATRTPAPAPAPRAAERPKTAPEPARPAAKPAPSEAPDDDAPAQRPAPAGEDDPQDFVDRLSKARPLLGGFVRGAKSLRVAGNKVVMVFDDIHYAQPLIDEKAMLDELATAVYGRKMTVAIETSSAAPAAGRRSEDKPSAAKDDPVLKAFQKHLGGELVDPKKR